MESNNSLLSTQLSLLVSLIQRSIDIYNDAYKRSCQINYEIEKVRKDLEKTLPKEEKIDPSLPPREEEHRTKPPHPTPSEEQRPIRRGSEEEPSASHNDKSSNVIEFHSKNEFDHVQRPYRETELYRGSESFHVKGFYRGKGPYHRDETYRRDEHYRNEEDYRRDEPFRRKEVHHRPGPYYSLQSRRDY